jgi:23S rRNA-/tRNA-specific pseudouridylate synthase
LSVNGAGAGAGTMITVRICAGDSGVRLDRFLRAHLPLQPLSAIYRCIRTGRIRVNGRKAEQGRRLAEGDEVRMEVAEAEFRDGSRRTP